MNPPAGWLLIVFPITNFFCSFVNWLLLFFLPIYLKSGLHLSDPRIGVLISVPFITPLLLAAPLGYLSDRFSPKRIVQAGIASILFYAAALTTVRDPTVLLFVQIVGGTGETFTIVALASLFFKHLQPAGRGRAVGVYTGAGLAGYAIGPFVAGHVLETAGLSFNQLSTLAVCTAAGLLVLSAALKDSPPVPIHLLEYRKDVLRPEVLLLILTLVGLGFHLGQERAAYPLYLKDVARLSDRDIGLLIITTGFWMGLLSFAIGRLFDRHKWTLHLIGLGLATSGVFHILTSFAVRFDSVLACRLAHTVGDTVVLFCFGVLAASLFPQSRLGGNYGFVYLFRMTGAFVGAQAAGYIDQFRADHRLSFAAAGLVTIAVGIVMGLNRRTVSRVVHDLTHQMEAVPAQPGPS